MTDQPAATAALPVLKRPIRRPAPDRVTRPIHPEPRDPVPGRVTR